ncbi:MAG: tetratricopeptide repeat protein [Ruminococcus sp.]|jgi:tetratricopeptide (TPR) repeat protein|nr:tetratricopeptide repeat protein [Ruminococcus sp.]
MNIIRKARGIVIPSTAQRVFLCLDTKNTEKRDTLIADLLQADPGIECVVSYIETPGDSVDMDVLRDELREGTKLLVLYVTAELLQGMKGGVFPPEYRLAKEFEVPILPIAADGSLFPLFTKLAGAIHGIALTDAEYKANLSAQLRNFLVTGEMLRRIMDEAFTSTVFLSYRKKDITEARKFMKALHDIEEFEAVSVWYDNFLTAGRIFDDEIRSSIENSNAFVLLVTPSLLEKNDMGKDNYVITTEYPYAKQKGKTIIAVEATKTDNKSLAKSFPGVGNTCGMDIDALREAFRAKLGESACLTNMDCERAYLLGMAYFKGVGVERDMNRGIKLFEKAVEAAGTTISFEKILSAEILMEIYMLGIGTKIDYDKAYEWGNIAATTAFFAKEYYDNKFIVHIFVNLGHVLKYLKNYDKAIEIYQYALEAVEDRDSEQGRLLAAGITASMANVYYEMGDYDKALQINNEALKIRNNDSDNPSYAKNLHNKGLVYEDKKDYQNALLCFNKAIEIQEKHLGSEHADTRASYNSLATLYYETQKYDEAISISERLLESLKKIHGQIHPEISDMLYNLAGYHWTRMVRMGRVVAGQKILMNDEILKAKHDKLKSLDYAFQAYINAYQYYDDKNNPRMNRCYILLKDRFTQLQPQSDFEKWLSQQIRQVGAAVPKPSTPQKKPGFFDRFRKKK